MANNKSFKVKNGLELEAYSKAISDTAVDVFVYDTRKDSDGGAWRKRTQHTSWYNEAASSIRGSRKEFPAVAVIVAESNQVTIYDGDDPDLPMWMVFNINGTNNFLLTGVSSITSTNGKIALGNTGSYARLMLVDFLAEESYWITSSSVTVKQQGIASRNSTTVNVNSSNYGTIVHSTVNDVAMTVLPNAPIDSATGLPVPTIAVATDGGTSVIKDDGTVVDIVSSTAAGGGYDPHHVSFDKDNRIIQVQAYDLSAVYLNIFDEIPSADIGQGLGYAQSRDYNYYDTALNIAGRIAANTFADLAHTKDSVAIGYNTQLTLLNENPVSRSNGMVAYITKDYATGHMVGDTKLATLSDTDDTDVTGSELVTNGTFDSDASGWSINTGSVSLSVSSGALVITTTSASYGYAYQAIAGLTVGETYTFSFNKLSSTAATWVRLGTAFDSQTYYGTTPSNGITNVTFTATSSTLYITLVIGAGSAGLTCSFDNISVRLAEEDRSVNGKGLQVFGTVTKNPVATGADLVAYSGFSSSNYLEQPYNSDLPLAATDDFFACAWIKTTTDSNYQIFMQFGSSGTGENRTLGVYATTGEFYVGVQGSNTGGSSSVNIGINTWRHVGVVSNGTGLLKLYVDGELYATDTLTLVDGTTSSTVRIGNLAGSFPMDGSVALARISATAPSPEQIKKIYEDEKVLFQENAKATLYGSSDAVTALAYDDSTDLLHVGTSAGRSDFQGLRRINNTTTAVGSAISASNGLIADD